MDLFEYIEHHDDMPESHIKHIFRQVVEAVGHLHAHDIVHRDIKDENVVIDSQLNVCLVDFGSAAKLDGKLFSTFYGTVEFTSPEVLQGARYEGKPQDIWSLGILLYTLMYRQNPFASVDDILAYHLKIPFILSQDSNDLLLKLLAKNVSDRPTIDSVLSHSWFI